MSATVPEPGPTRCPDEEESQDSQEYKNDALLMNEKRSYNDFEEQDLVVTFETVANLEETASNSECLNTSSVEEASEEGLDHACDMPMRQNSKWKWTEKEIIRAKREMQEYKRSLKTENEISEVKLELKKINSSSKYFQSLTEKVGTMQTIIADAQQEKLKRASEIAILKKEVKELKNQQAKSFSRFDSERKSLNLNRLSSSLSGLKSLFVHDVQVDNLPKTHPLLDNNYLSVRSLSPSYSERQSIRSCPAAYLLPQESYHERDAASLERKIKYLKTQKNGSETEVQELQRQVAQLTKTLERIIFLGKKVKSSKGKTHLEMEKENLSKGRSVFTTAVWFGRKNNETFERKSREELVQNSNANTRFSFLTGNKKRSNHFKTLSKSERPSVRSVSTSIIL